MSECVGKESSMTGSTRAGPLKPPVNPTPLKDLDRLMSSGHCRLENEATILRSSSCQEATRILRKMTPVRPQSAQPIQLTPLWEHVVRTRSFPSEVDTQETFDEITDRLKDPEWEVRQHALRVLVDVLPTLDVDVIDDAMTNVFPQLINNLGHLAPAVRKGAIDTLRVYLVCSRKKEDIVKKILNDGLLRQDGLDIFHSNVTLGVILSVPSLLFPSSNNSRPSDELVRQAIGTLATRLVQVTHQEASLRSLVKIQELLGSEDFHFYLNQLDVNAKRDYEILCNVYKIKPSEKNSRKQSGKMKKKRERNVVDRSMAEERKSDESNEEGNDDEILERGKDVLENEEIIGKPLNSANSASRIVLETEIKFNEETAITMTIIEQKDEDVDRETCFDCFNESTKNLEEEMPLEIKYDIVEAEDNEIIDEWIEKRKTPRRVHFGGEIVKLRTPDSDDSEIPQTNISQSKIPIPVSTATKTIAVRSRKSRSNPCSPNVVRSRLRKTKSVSNSPKREFYVHDASLSPKKGILMKSIDNTIAAAIRKSEDCKKKMEAKVDTIFGRQESDDSGWAFEIYDNDDFINASRENIDNTKDSIGPTKDHESAKKKRNIEKSIDHRSRNNETRKSHVEENSQKIFQNITDARSNSSLDKIDDLKNSANSRINEESSKGRRNSIKANEKIGKIEANEKPEINVENPSEVFADSNMAKEGSTKKLGNAKKRRDSSKTEMEKIEIDATGVIDNRNDFNENSINSTKDSTDLNNVRELTKKNLDGINDEFSKNNKISEIRENDSLKVEGVKSAEGSRVTLESSKSESPREKKQEDLQESRVSTDGISVSSETRQVEENFESTNERNSSSDLQNRASPHSPRKHVFETFPRKERNYILMELASPVKTNSRKMSENFENATTEEQTPVEAEANNSSSTGENSHEAEYINDREVSRNVSNENLIPEESMEKTDESTVATERTRDVKKSDSFDSDESPLKNIIITEVTKFRESNWEDLGLVDQEVLNDLHNKDDWRARVRGLERVASALRTSSALIAIEPRLGSLLQAVLGGERSCRVAAAGMAVARVVVAGVSEEALKRRLPQVAWGLARQGGPNAAQLARVAMLRLRPALLLEQFLQPHCIKARNAKTRENALQLLIFSLVTFPSTEFKVEKVAYKVACMVGDKRRRVRQAALDTLAVLAQIYEPEEVMKASKLASKGQQEGDAMLAAIRARLARKSLPMVSADGLVLYGLQISPTIQIATGPDVDWIIAGSGSVSPGTGRTRGQIIATTPRQGAQEQTPKREFSKSSSSTKGPNFVALGVGLETKNGQKKPLAWQLVQPLSQDEGRRIREKSLMDGRDENVVSSDDSATESRLTGTLRHYRSATDRLDDSYASNDADPIFLIDDKDVIMKQRKTEENFHRRMDEIYAERVGGAPISQDIKGNRLESRIPVPQTRDRETNGKDTARTGAVYPRRKLFQEGNNLEDWSAGSRISDTSRPQSTHRDDHSQTDINSRRYEEIGRESSQHPSAINDTYRSIYRQGRGFADGNVYREVQTAPTTTSYDVTRRRQSLKETMAARYVPASRRIISEEPQTSATTESSDGTTTARGRKDKFLRYNNPNINKGDKSTIEEEDHNEINKCHFSVQTNLQRIQNSNDQSSQCPVRISDGTLETSSNESSNISEEAYERTEILEKFHNERNSIEDSFVVENNDNVLGSPVNGPVVEKSFNIISHEINPSRRNSVDFAISSQDIHSNIVCTNDIDESEKDSSIEEVSIVSRIRSSHEKFVMSRDDENDSSETEEKFNDIDRNVGRIYVTNETNSSDDGISKISDDSPISNESHETEIENENLSKSPTRVDSSYAIRSIETVAFDNSSPSTDENNQPEAAVVSYVSEHQEDMRSENVREISEYIEDDESVRSEIFRRHSHDRRESTDREEKIISIVVASRPHSQNSRNNEDNVSIASFDFRQSQNSLGNSIVTSIRDNDDSSLFTRNLEEATSVSVSLEKMTGDNESIEQIHSRDLTDFPKIDCSSNTENEDVLRLPEVPEVIGSRAGTSEKTEVQKRAVTSRISRIRRTSRTNVARVAPMQPNGQPIERSTSKSRTLIQQCFTQLESNDWEVTMKGLRGLSQIARQQPEQLDSCAPGTVGRLLGRHVRNLRSQVSRAACLAAGDVFGSQARWIDQDLDDIAGSLLHRTADTNKFLRADSNEALDRMVEHLPPHKMIAVIVHRGATHQNAIVRATTARLLASIVDRIGPDHVMSMSREVREKLIATGAKLLMDGNLDARNHTKKIFRELSRCEGFRKVLKDSVPESTLRNIDKTLRSLK